MRPGRHPAFTGVELDRASMARRDPARVAELLHARDATSVLASNDGVLLDSSGQPTLLRVAVTEIISDWAEPILLGIDDRSAVFAVDLRDLGAGVRERLIAAGRIATLRDAGAVLSRAEGGLAAYLTALLGWHRRHRFCANC